MRGSLLTRVLPVSISYIVLPVSTTEPGPSSSNFVRHPSSQDQAMRLQPATASRDPSHAGAAATRNAPLSPHRLGGLALADRLVMSPMARSRAHDGDGPHPRAA